MDSSANVKALIYFLLQYGCGIWESWKLTEVQVWALDFLQIFTFFFFSEFRPCGPWHIPSLKLFFDHIWRNFAQVYMPFYYQIHSHLVQVSTKSGLPLIENRLVLNERTTQIRSWIKDRLLYVTFGHKFVSESKIVASWNIFRILNVYFRYFSPIILYKAMETWMKSPRNWYQIITH